MRLAVVAVALSLVGCGEGSPRPAADAAPAEPDGYPPPRDDLVAAIGDQAALDLATWNIENFPQYDNSARIVADLVTSLRLDFVAVQEIADVVAFAELAARLPRHDAVLSTHSYGDGSYQKVGFLYRSDLVTLADDRLLFTDEGYVFPRPPLQVRVTVDGGAASVDFVAIVVHLKAGRGDDDRDRRRQAVELLESHVRDLVAGVDADVVVLGDFNEVVTNFDGREVMAPFLSSSDYEVHSAPLAEAGDYSFVPSEVVLDHVVTTSALDDEIGEAEAIIPELDQEVAGYLSVVSDHLPVAIGMAGLTAP